MLTQRKIHTHGAIGHDFMECTEDTFRTAVKPHYEIWDEQYFLINLQQYADEHLFFVYC